MTLPSRQVIMHFVKCEATVDKLQLPSQVGVQLFCDGKELAVTAALGFHFFFPGGMDLDIGPFVTDDNGHLKLTEEDFLLYIEAAYAFDEETYPPFDTAFSLVEVCVWSDYDMSCAWQRRKRWPDEPSVNGKMLPSEAAFTEQIRKWHPSRPRGLDMKRQKVRIRDEWTEAFAVRDYDFPLHRRRDT